MSALSTLLVLALALLARVQAHGMHAQADASSSDHKCPVCRMSTLGNGYNNQNWVELKNGQRVYTCGMDPRPFEGYSFQSTDTAYLGANMAEFIVATSDTDNYKCTSACEECASGDLRDPISGIPVTADSYKIVCLTNGQKIYFASDETRTSYLAKVNKEVRTSVTSMTCSGSKCSDSTQITTLSTAAKAFDPSSVKDAATTTGSKGTSGSSSKSNSTSSSTTTKTTTTPSPSSTNSASNVSNSDAASSANDGFCAGEGSVMFNGFSSTINGSCVRLFFQPWVLNSAFKYVLGFFGCLLIAFGNEYLVKFREQLRQKLLEARKARRDDKMHRLGCKALLAVMYMIQMTVAYFAMLVVMTYETGLFIALILGFGAGFVFFKDFDQDVTNERGVWRYTDPSVVRIQVEGMSCMANCGTTVENALLGTEGVTKAFVQFDEKCAYVAGSAPHSKLIDTIEAVGFSATIVQSSAFTPATNVGDSSVCDVKKTV